MGKIVTQSHKFGDLLVLASHIEQYGSCQEGPRPKHDCIVLLFFPEQCEYTKGWRCLLFGLAILACVVFGLQTMAFACFKVWDWRASAGERGKEREQIKYLESRVSLGKTQFPKCWASQSKVLAAQEESLRI